MAVVTWTWRQCVIVACLAAIILIGVSSGGTERRPSIAAWKDLNFQEKPLPSTVFSRKTRVEITENTVDVDGKKIYYKASKGVGEDNAEATGIPVLLLHGAAFTSQTWVDKVDTIATLSALGHPVIAVDLPGYGNSRKESVDNKGEFLKNLIKQLFGDKKIVVVTPSMSGSFFIPMLLDQEARSQIAGWVPVAPVSTSQPAGFYSAIQIPTLIVHGENDVSLGHRSRDDLSELPNATKPQVLPGAGHPAYLDQPELWHTLLYNFLSHLQP